MFHNKEDVDFFKPVKLRTRCGRVGHIKESLGECIDKKVLLPVFFYSMLVIIIYTTILFSQVLMVI